MPTPRHNTTKPSATRRVPDLNQEVANALGASTGTEIPKPEPQDETETEATAEKSQQARGLGPKSSQ